MHSRDNPNNKERGLLGPRSLLFESNRLKSLPNDLAFSATAESQIA